VATLTERYPFTATLVDAQSVQLPEDSPGNSPDSGLDTD